MDQTTLLMHNIQALLNDGRDQMARMVNIMMQFHTSQSQGGMANEPPVHYSAVMGTWQGSHVGGPSPLEQMALLLNASRGILDHKRDQVAMMLHFLAQCQVVQNQAPMTSVSGGYASDAMDASLGRAGANPAAVDQMTLLMHDAQALQDEMAKMLSIITLFQDDQHQPVMGTTLGGHENDSTSTSNGSEVSCSTSADCSWRSGITCADRMNMLVGDASSGASQNDGSFDSAAHHGLATKSTCFDRGSARSLLL
eukprot:TRINITY_DN82193_c0_g1_i1.p1 TRINITY_DN82193_c0_g1~~TRINITY_DN82193_c0_g1_i1.p1  ORF type:complete len:269 (+),score=45.84 TRINITY_DN82193_c0_g1_i1:51-809(+)